MRQYDPERLIQARAKSGMLQRDVARRLGVHRSTIYRAEQGRASAELVLDIAELLDVPVSDLFEKPRVKTSKNGNHRVRQKRTNSTKGR